MTGWRSTTHPQFGPLRNLSVLVEIVQTDAAPRTSEDMHITYEGHGRIQMRNGSIWVECSILHHELDRLVFSSIAIDSNPAQTGLLEPSFKLRTAKPHAPIIELELRR